MAHLDTFEPPEQRPLCPLGNNEDLREKVQKWPKCDRKVVKMSKMWSKLVQKWPKLIKMELSDGRVPETKGSMTDRERTTKVSEIGQTSSKKWSKTVKKWSKKSAKVSKPAKSVRKRLGEKIDNFLKKTIF